MTDHKKRWLSALVILATVVPALGLGRGYAQSTQGDSRLFPETGKSVARKFLAYCNGHGGLPQQGYPISEQMQERSDTDGKVYTVQYFERSVFELHVENDAEYIVLLSLLGNFRYKAKYPGGAPNQQPNNESGSRPFPETGKRVGGVFLD